MQTKSYVVGLLTVSAALGCSDPDAESLKEPWPIDEASGLRVSALPPLGEPPVWEDNPVTPEKEELGHRLFFEFRLSGSGKTSCVSCHAPTSDFQASTVRDSPDRSQPLLSPALDRNTPSLVNLVYMPVFRWDASHKDLVEVLAFPLAESNMNTAGTGDPEDIHAVDVQATKRKLREKVTTEMPEYAALYRAAFGVDLKDASDDDVWRMTGQAFAVYLSKAVSRNSDFDRWNAGELDELDESALRGLSIFLGKGRCVACHSGPLLSDFQLHNVGTDLPDERGNRADGGQSRVTGEESDAGKFLTPSLRTALASAPYLHDGSIISIKEVIAKKTSADSLTDPLHDPLLATMTPLSDDEVADLIKMLKAFRGEPVPRDLLDPLP